MLIHDAWNVVGSLALPIRVVAWALAAIKLWEMAHLVVWALRSGTVYRVAVLDLVVSGADQRTVDMDRLRALDTAHRLPKPLFFLLPRYLHSRRGQDVRLRGLVEMVGNLFTIADRLPVPIALLVLLVMVSPQMILLRWELLLILSLIVLAVLDLVIARSVLGFADNLRRAFELSPPAYYSMQSYRWSKTEFMGKFLTGTLFFVGASILGFAAIFYWLHLESGGKAFDGLLAGAGAPEQLQFIYFSVVTTATVGYGDIKPVTLLSQMAAATEMVTNIAVLIILIAGLSATFTPDDG